MLGGGPDGGGGGGGGGIGATGTQEYNCYYNKFCISPVKFNLKEHSFFTSDIHGPRFKAMTSGS